MRIEIRLTDPDNPSFVSLTASEAETWVELLETFLAAATAATYIVAPETLYDAAIDRLEERREALTPRE